MHIYIYIYIHTYITEGSTDFMLLPWTNTTLKRAGAKYCTPEIDTSEIIVDFQRHFPMDLGAFSNGLSLVSGVFQRIVTFRVCLLEMPNGLSVACSDGIPLL